MKRHLGVLAMVAAVTCMTVACSSSSESSSKSSPATISGSGATPLPAKRIGVVGVTMQSESVARWADNTKTAAEALGWSAEIKDGQNNPQVWPQQAQQLVAEKVDAIITIGIDAPTISQTLQEAKAAGIPVIAADITVDPTGKDLFTANYSDDDQALGSALANYAADKTPQAKAVAQNLSPVYGADRFVQAFGDQLAARHGFVEDVQDLDIANVAESFSKTAVSLTQGHPDASYLLGCCDIAPVLDMPALQQAGNTSTTLLARYDNPSTLEYIRSGAKVVAVAANTDRTNLQALDVLAAYFASQEPIPAVYPNDDFQLQIVDEANVPSEGQIYDFDQQLEEYKTKWGSEYKLDD